MAELVRAVEEDSAVPFRDDLGHPPHGEGEERHRGAERDEPRTQPACLRGELVEVDLELDRIQRDVHDGQTADAGRAVVAIRGVPSDRLGERHDRVARPGQGGVHRHIAEHARDEAMLGVARPEEPLQQLDAERFDLVDVAGSGEPAVHRADVTFRRALADLGREERLHSGRDERLRC